MGPIIEAFLVFVAIPSIALAGIVGLVYAAVVTIREAAYERTMIVPSAQVIAFARPQAKVSESEDVRRAA